MQARVPGHGQSEVIHKTVNPVDPILESTPYQRVILWGCKSLVELVARGILGCVRKLDARLAGYELCVPACQHSAAGGEHTCLWSSRQAPGSGAGGPSSFI